MAMHRRFAIVYYFIKTGNRSGRTLTTTGYPYVLPILRNLGERFTLQIKIVSDRKRHIPPVPGIRVLGIL